MSEKKKSKKQDDRRDSPRVPMTFLLRDAARNNDEWVERQGDISLGGIYWKGKTPPFGSKVEVRFRLQGVPREVRTMGEIIRILDMGNNLDFHVRFTDLDVQSELIIARHLDEWLNNDD